MAARQATEARSGWHAALAVVSCLLLTTNVDGAAAYAKRSLAARILNGASGFKPVFVTLGDSITEFGGNEGGWQLMLSRDYVRKADVINRGFSGYNSRWGTYLVDEIVEAFKDRVELVTLCFGANDAAGASTSVGYLSVPLEEYKNNIRTIITKLRENGITNIVVMSPPPVNDANNRFPDGARSNERARKYAEAALSVARSLKLPAINLHAKIQEQPGWRTGLMNPDGLHMGPEGNRFIFEHLTAAVSKQYPHLSPPHLPLHFPSYDHINATAPAETFEALLGHKAMMDAYAATIGAATGAGAATESAKSAKSGGAAGAAESKGGSSDAGAASSNTGAASGAAASGAAASEGGAIVNESGRVESIDPLASFATTPLLGMAEQILPAPASAGPGGGILANIAP